MQSYAILVTLFLLGTCYFDQAFAEEIQKEKIVPADPDVGKNMVEIVTTRGYTIETHYVTTKDNYILTMFRIPHGKNPTTGTTSPPVILQHGLLDSSFTWVSNYEDQSLGYILADQGFDVWFGNNRGNTWGRNHTSKSPDDKSSGFWDFSWDEMAFYDVPAMIHYVLDNTAAMSVGWVGHSEGTIQMFAAGTSLEASNVDEYFISALKSVNLFVALAPVGYVSNQRSKLVTILADTKLPEKLYEKEIYEFLPDGKIDVIAPEICRMVEKACDAFLMTLCGPSLNLNASRIQVYVSNTPAGTSTRNMQHWQQGVLVSTFQRYDYGSAEVNAMHYGVETAPLYDLSQLAVPTALFYGDNDYLADLEDVKKIIAEAPEEMIVYKKETKNYGHLDYVWAYNANTIIYGDVAMLLAQYSDDNTNNARARKNKRSLRG